MTDFGFQFELPLRRNGYFFMSKESFDQYSEGKIVGPYQFSRTDSFQAKKFINFCCSPNIIIRHFRNDLGEMVKIIDKFYVK